MRRPWIKIETATPDKPEICAIATSLRMDPDAVLGKLVRLWSWVEVNRVSANDLGVTREFLDKLVGRKGFASALVACGWLSDAEGRLGLPNLDRHNGGSAKVRALTAQRVALHRQRKQIASLSSVSEPLDPDVTSSDATSEFNDAKIVSTTEQSLVDQREHQTEEAMDVVVKAVTSVEEMGVVHSPDATPLGNLSADEFLAGDVPRFEEVDSPVSAPPPVEPTASASVEPPVQEALQETPSIEPPPPPVLGGSADLPADTPPSEDPPSRKRRPRPTPEPNPDQPLLF